MGRFERDKRSFGMIPDAVCRGFRRLPTTITEIEREQGCTFHGDLDQRRLREKRVWSNKKDMDAFVADELGLDVDSYSAAQQRVFYQRVVSVISGMRENGELVDWRYSGGPRRGPRYGIWRLADPVEAKEFSGFQRGDYASPPGISVASRRAKQGQFRRALLGSFRHCLFCRFTLDQYLRAAHIVPFSVMQREEPANSMNPANGLLLCSLCDEAYETGAVTVDEDYRISRDAELAPGTPDAAGKCWPSSIDERLQIRKASDLRPEPRYLGWKLRLVGA